MKTTKEIIEQQKIVIDKDQLREVLKEEIENALNFDWSGWRIPIYVSDSGKVSAGDWLSNSSYQPGLTELIGVEPWSIEWDVVADAMNYDSVEELTEDDKQANIEAEVDELIDSYKTDIESSFDEMDDDLPIEIDKIACYDNYIRIPVMADEDESDKIIKFIEYHELRNDIKQMYESITGAFQDDEGDIIFVDDQNNYYK